MGQKYVLGHEDAKPSTHTIPAGHKFMLFTDPDKHNTPGSQGIGSDNPAEQKLPSTHSNPSKDPGTQ
jgi:hypothetical protein